MIEQALHQHWAQSPVLCALLPVSRLCTGIAHAAGVPYATVTREKSRVRYRTSAGSTIDEVIVRIDIWHSEHAPAMAILQAVRAALDRAPLELPGPSAVLATCLNEDQVRQHDDGFWQVSVWISVYVFRVLESEA